MNCYMITIFILCWINFVSCLGPSQDCINADEALADSTDCENAFNSIAAAASDSPVCSGTCKSLIEDVLDNCPSKVHFNITMYTCTDTF